MGHDNGIARPSSPLARSFLFAPGNHLRRVEKALSLAADAVISNGGPRPLRARAVIPPDPAALRAVAKAH